MYIHVHIRKDLILEWNFRPQLGLLGTYLESLVYGDLGLQRRQFDGGCADQGILREPSAATEKGVSAARATAAARALLGVREMVLVVDRDITLVDVR